MAGYALGMGYSSSGCPEHLLQILLSHLSPGALDPRAVFRLFDCRDSVAVGSAIARAYPCYSDQSWAMIVAEQWAEQEAA